MSGDAEGFVTSKIKSDDGVDVERFMETLTIAPHVYVCVTADGSVLLDLKRDKYLGFGKDATQLLANAIALWPKPRWSYSMGSLASTEAMAETGELLAFMAAEGLLSPNRDQSDGRTFAPAGGMKRDWISIGDELEVASAVTTAHVANFAAAFLWARGSLALRSFWRTVESVRSQKERRGGNGNFKDLLAVAGLVGIFRRLRPFAFAAENRCLLHALTLIKFLSRYGFYPEWVIGVATRQWGAHSWVQWGDFLLDTNPDKVCRYTPILVV